MTSNLQSALIESFSSFYGVSNADANDLIKMISQNNPMPDLQPAPVQSGPIENTMHTNIPTNDMAMSPNIQPGLAVPQGVPQYQDQFMPFMNDAMGQQGMQMSHNQMQGFPQDQTMPGSFQNIHQGGPMYQNPSPVHQNPPPVHQGPRAEIPGQASSSSAFFDQMPNSGQPQPLVSDSQTLSVNGDGQAENHFNSAMLPVYDALSQYFSNMGFGGDSEPITPTRPPLMRTTRSMAIEGMNTNQPQLDALGGATGLDLDAETARLLDSLSNTNTKIK